MYEPNFPSDGTQLALYSLFRNVDDVIVENRHEKFDPPPFNFHRYDIHLWNVDTLLRNLITDNKVNELFIGRHKYVNKLKESILSEMGYMVNLYDNVDIRLTFYMPNYTEVRKIYENVGGKLTQRNKVDELTRLVKNKITQNDLNNINADAFKCSYKLPKVNGNVLITTHYGIDLLNIKQIKNLSLMESNSGVVKSFIEFNTKYKPFGNRKYIRLPYDERLLYLIGDRTFLNKNDRYVRKMIYHIAEKEEFTAVTDINKVMYILKKDEHIKKALYGLKRFF